MPNNATIWTEQHESFCFTHKIPPAAKSLWQWLMRQGYIGSEIEPDLSEFNEYIFKVRGKGYSHNYLKQMLQVLIENRVVQVVKQYSWKIFRLITRPLEWLQPRKKPVEKNLQNHNFTYKTEGSNSQNLETGYIQQQQLQIQTNREILAENNILFDETDTEVLDRPSHEIKLALALFQIRSESGNIINPEGWIKVALRDRYWEHPTNYRLLFLKYAASTLWLELFPEGTDIF